MKKIKRLKNLSDKLFTTSDILMDLAIRGDKEGVRIYILLLQSQFEKLNEMIEKYEKHKITAKNE